MVELSNCCLKCYIALVTPMFRFSIRDVMWLTVVAGVFAAWAVNRNQLLLSIERERQEQELFKKSNIKLIREVQKLREDAGIYEQASDDQP